MIQRVQSRIPAIALAALLMLCTHALAEAPAPAENLSEDAFLDILPKVDVPEDVQPIPGAVNEEFRTCRTLWPAEYEMAQSRPEARALRDIYSLVRARNVISTRDCTCVGKVASWNEVEKIASALRGNNNVQQLGWQQTQEISVEATRLISIAKTMCGGSF